MSSEGTRPHGAKAQGRVLRVNEAIPASRVLLVGADGRVIGEKPIAEALEAARRAGMDLVEVGPTASPPVCRMMTPGEARLRAERQLTEREQERELRSLRFPVGVSEADFRLKIAHGRAFLREGGAVEIRVVAPGRTDRNTVRQLVERILAALLPVGVLSGSQRREHDEIVILVEPTENLSQ